MFFFLFPIPSFPYTKGLEQRNTINSIDKANQKQAEVSIILKTIEN